MEGLDVLAVLGGEVIFKNGGGKDGVGGGARRLVLFAEILLLEVVANSFSSNLSELLFVVLFSFGS